MRSPEDGFDGFDSFIAWDNLCAAYLLAARGKRASAAVAHFEYGVGEQLLSLQATLAEGTWRPGPYRHFALHETKRRWISAAPFADRVVHHALVRIVEPRFEAHFIADSYANRVGKGTHRAIRRCQVLAQRHEWVLRMDIRQHFASIDHAILMDLLGRRISEPGLRAIVGHVLASGDGVMDPALTDDAGFFPGDDLLALARPRGLPVGNLTSQFWSNCYLDPLDQFVQRSLRCSAYLRYADDFALFADDKRQLAAWRDAIVAFLAQQLRLRAHEGSAQASRTAAGIPWLGFVVYPDRIRVKSRKVVEATRRLRHYYNAWAEGAISFAEFDASVQGWIAHVAHGDTWGLRAHVLGGFDLAVGDRTK